MPPQTTPNTNNYATDLKKDRAILTAAPPPLHAVVVIAVMVMVSVYFLPGTEALDQVATMETFTRCIFSNYISIPQLAYIRFAIASLIWCTSLVTMVGTGWQQKTSYRTGSKLLMVPNTLSGIKTMFPFTSWSWNLLGASFTLSGWIAWNATDNHVEPVILRAALVCWELAAPFSFLVAAVVRYSMWPAVLRASGETSELKSWRNKMMHNANVLFALTETALLGGLPVQSSHVCLGTLVGCIYVVFSWNMTNQWNDTSQVGPQFIYFFFDTTLPGYFCSIAILALLMTLMVFHTVFCSAEGILDWLDGGLVTRVLFVAVLCSVVMRFRD